MRAVHRFLQQRGGIARAFALAVFERTLHLFAVGVILKALRIGLRVENYRAVRRDPCQAIVSGGELFEIVRPVCLHSGSSKRQLIMQLLFFDAAEIFVQAAHDDKQARQQHRSGHRQNGTEDFFGHAFPSMR